jgi:hypothetical protein
MLWTRRTWLIGVATLVTMALFLPTSANEGQDQQADQSPNEEPAKSTCGDTTIFIVANAEQEKYPANDPTLSYKGKNRARGLRDALRHVRLSAIYVSEFRASRETASLTASSKNLNEKQIGGPDLPILVDALKTKYVGKYVLVVRPAKEIPSLMKELGVQEDQIPRIAANAADNLFILTLKQDGVRNLMRLHYLGVCPR